MTSKVTLTSLRSMKEKKEKITALTAYDYSFASLLDEAGIDIILVGDSLGMAIRGEDNTLKVTVDEMVYHTGAVRKGVKRAMLVADMPFMSFHVSPENTLENAGRLIRAGAEAVKLEGASGGVLESVKRLVSVGIPVMGHVGLTPQAVHQMGGFKLQGKGVEAGRKIIDDAMALENAGAFSIVLECVPVSLAEEITEKIKVPVIGIGAGAGCDGQILVSYDMLGIPSGITPKFVKKYADLSNIIKEATTAYIKEIRAEKFPTEEFCYTAPTRRLKAI
ncbi:3-methyl-2-oxobutanoate hydroxymethyltransferase [hydrothermal vent metagenome]|uniref:3-methyl-2-oxobutanoate hydroxymethyltransferase n=1 Tax=hydrothermal vent metagenome TaxID=652676 RepID=A0A3B1C005_9ZZZZ